LRNARGGIVPDPVEAALIAEKAGADGIVCHLREDRRHIRDADVVRLRQIVTTKLDLEMAATPEIIAIAKKIKPDLVTLVPEKRKELTTEGGLDVVRVKKQLKKVIAEFHDKGVPVSLFIDPDRDQVETSKEIEADMIEIHTGEYADAKSARQSGFQLKRIKAMALFGQSLGMVVNAGHGLDYTNIHRVAAIRNIEEVSIGHAVIVRAMEVGLENAVKEMVQLLNRGKRD
jgi:pyridoxine 5-phosphate synthase